MKMAGNNPAIHVHAPDMTHFGFNIHNGILLHILL